MKLGLESEGVSDSLSFCCFRRHCCCCCMVVDSDNWECCIAGGGGEAVDPGQVELQLRCGEGGWLRQDGELGCLRGSPCCCV